MAMRYSLGSDYTGLPQSIQPVDRSLVPSGRSGPGAGNQACSVTHRCLGHWLGTTYNRNAVSGVGTDPQLLWHTNCLELIAVLLALRSAQSAPLRQGCFGPYRQHGDLCVYQPAMRFTHPSHVATRPSTPPLESEASEVASCHPHPRSVQ